MPLENICLEFKSNVDGSYGEENNDDDRLFVIKGINNSLIKCSKLTKTGAMKLVLRQSLVLKAGMYIYIYIYICMYIYIYL
jgi:hypothetical protein